MEGPLTGIRVLELGTLIAAPNARATKLSGNTVKFGATVTVIDEDTSEKRVWRIVGEPEADAKSGKISIFRRSLAR